MLAAVTGRVDVEGVRRLMGVAGTADLPTRLPRVARSSQTSDSIPVLDVFQGPTATRTKSGQAMARMPDPV